MPIPIPFIIILVLMIVFFVSSIRILKESQRAAIFRLGRFVGVGRPGIVFLIPIVEKVKVVDLNKWVPEWRELSKAELEERVQAVALLRDEK
jgi:regulator of protease activity HflC (stomatin/prohibitin superfamily)